MHAYCDFERIRDALYGEILLARCKGTGKKVAIKSLRRSCVDSRIPRTGGCVLSEDVHFEIACMKALNKNGGHRNIMKMLDTFDSDDSKRINLVLEYQPGGELFDQVINQGRLDESTAQRYFADAVGGLQHIHKAGYVHRDLSLENCLLSHDDSIVITDFGLASERSGKNTERVGKGFYIAPEVYEIDNNHWHAYDGAQADIWSLGVILFMCLTGVPPTDAPSPDDKRFRLIATGRLEGMVRGWGMRELFTDDAMDLVARMLQPDPTERITLAEIRLHPYVKALLDRREAEEAGAETKEHRQEAETEVCTEATATAIQPALHICMGQDAIAEVEAEAEAIAEVEPQSNTPEIEEPTYEFYSSPIVKAKSHKIIDTSVFTSSLFSSSLFPSAEEAARNSLVLFNSNVLLF